MRVLWSLPKAAPALLRHLGAYIELIASDLDQARRDAIASIMSAMVIGIGLLFAVLMGCLAVIAVTWDTPHRLAAIAWMGGGFLVVALIGLVYRSNTSSGQAPFLDSVRREWEQDSVIFERILADDDP
jgi:uncharacterized membrane protein YqjE